MRINADFSRRVVVAPDQHRWVASPQGGVERMMLDRVGAENARATSLVRYAPQSSFPRHAHPGGEEILVLSGTFADDDADYPAGWYLRNPPGSSHRPHSDDGAVIFVKLQQMQIEERQQVSIDTRDAAAWRHENGRDVCPLFRSSDEQVNLYRLKPGQRLPDEPAAGGEVLVIEGEVMFDALPYADGSWFRLPPGDPATITAGANGATVYRKTGHLDAAIREKDA